MTMKDRVFVWRPGFDDSRITYFCPYSAQVIGFLTYYPQVRETIELVELGFEKPRMAPVDVLRPEAPAAPPPAPGGWPAPGPTTPRWTAHRDRFVEKTIEILRYLAATRSVPGPH